MTDLERIEIAAACHDCDAIPKVTEAGSVVDFPGGSYQVMHNGVRIYVDSHYGTYNTEVIRRLRGHHEPQEERAFHDVLKTIPKNGVMMELGSFWAYYSLWFTSAVEGGRAFMIEPLPSALSAGEKNFKLNASRGTFLRARIADVEAPEAEVELWPGMKTVVETVTVDVLMKRFQLDHIDLLHSDIQGAEVKMLKGAKSALKCRRVSWIFISTHSENIHQKCLMILRSHRYKIVTQHTPSESHSVDGLLVASADSSATRIAISRLRSWAATKARARALIRVRVLEPLGLRRDTA